jgi:MFS family permease
MMPADRRRELTYRYERWRAVSTGVLETAGTTFLLLIAVQHFQASAWSKALVAGGGSLGLILSPWIVSRVERLGWPVAQAASRLAMLGAASMLVMALVPFLPVFVLGSVVAMATVAAAIPLMTQMFQDNYPEHERGRLFSRTVMIRIATAAAFSELAGRALSGRLERFQGLLLLFAAAFALAAFCLSRCPSRPLHAMDGSHPFKALRFVREDRLFRNTLVMWMLMGFGNLMMIPLRVEYLANPQYGVTMNDLPLTAAGVALLTGVVPNLARLALNPFWGWAFDRMNFFALRMVLNVGFAIGIFAFFSTNSVVGLVAAAVVFGISNAGGDVAWSLWVTKFAAPERVADYMSVHTFFTGLRGVVAPVVAFQLLAHWSVAQISWLSVGLIVAATTLLIPELKFGKRARRAGALVEEVSE